MALSTDLAIDLLCMPGKAIPKQIHQSSFRAQMVRDVYAVGSRLELYAYFAVETSDTSNNLVI